MRRHLTNAAYGVLDYASYPLGMLVAAPVILHRLGASEYGLWMIATAIVSAGGIIASGFCDANIQRVALLRARGESDSVAETVRSVMGINLVLGFAIAAAVWIAAPFAARHFAMSATTPAAECLICIRIASGLILVRAIESVGISTHRAFEQYRGTVQISTAVRLLTLASAVALVLFGGRTESILLATGFFLIAGVVMQLRGLHALLGPIALWPRFHVGEIKVLLGPGVFVWLQTLGSVVFGQFDRILLGVSMGALAVAPYALSVQLAQPVFGLTASGLHFLFPYLSRRAQVLPSVEMKQIVLKAFAANLGVVAASAGLGILFGDRLIRLWAGPAIAASAKGIFVPIVIGSALMGLSVSGTYAMQSLGKFRTVALISLAGRFAMLPVMMYLLHHVGLRGLASARACYGFVALIVYLPLIRELGRSSEASDSARRVDAPCDLQEGSHP